MWSGLFCASCSYLSCHKCWCSSALSLKLAFYHPLTVRVALKRNFDCERSSKVNQLAYAAVFAINLMCSSMWQLLRVKSAELSWGFALDLLRYCGEIAKITSLEFWFYFKTFEIFFKILNNFFKSFKII